MRFPKGTEMMIAPFVRPPPGIDDDELLREHLAQDKVCISAREARKSPGVARVRDKGGLTMKLEEQPSIMAAAYCTCVCLCLGYVVDEVGVSSGSGGGSGSGVVVVVVNASHSGRGCCVVTAEA